MTAFRSRPTVRSQSVDSEFESVVTHSMDVNVKVVGFENADDLIELLGLEQEQSMFVNVTAVGALERAGEVLTDTVEQDLDHRGRGPPRRRLLSTLWIATRRSLMVSICTG